MPTGIVEAVGVSRTGKPTVTIGGQIYSASKCQPSTIGLPIGSQIEFDSASSIYNNATVWFINSYKLLQAVSGSPSAKTQPQQNSAPTPPNGLTEGERLTVSNWVAAAITSGKISDPTEMALWARSACKAIRDAGKPTQEELDDDIPF